MKKPYAKGPSRHYTWAEVNPHNFPGLGPRLRLKAIRHARKLEQLRTQVNASRAKHRMAPTGINILSWWRPEWYNRKIGGAAKSQHIQALATDIAEAEIQRLMPWSSGKLEFDRMADKLFRTDGFGQYPGGSRHVDSRGYRARWSSFRPGK